MFSRFQEMPNPKKFDQLYKLSKVIIEEFLPRCMKSMTWKPKERILDVGCGPGGVTSEVLMRHLEEKDFSLLVGADNCDGMIKYASETYEKPKLTFTLFDVAKDLENTSQLQPPKYDKIFSFYCLNHIPDPHHRYYLAIKPRFHF
jgi:2-polyprenyl-3-methyl-5-hydroxy-6-metoxy-1,4-benzoquinol methylase